MPKFNLYSAWMDPVVYAWAAAFAVALVTLVYCIRKYLELKNASFDEDETALDGDLEVYPAEAAAEAQPELIQPEPQPVQPELAEAAAEPDPEPAPAQEESPAPGSPAENFVRGIYEGISDLDTRLKGIEAALSKGRINGDFTVKFLEDILQDIDSLDKAKLKARLEYLVSDLKK